MSQTYAQILTQVTETIGDPDGDRSLVLAADAVRKAINELNSQVWWFQYVPAEDITLDTRFPPEYALSQNPIVRVNWGWLLNIAQTNVQKPIPVLPLETFIRGGLFTNPRVGLPNQVTWDESTSKLRFDRQLDSASVGRVVRVSYYTAIPNPPVSGLDDIPAGLVVECATWRVRRNIPGYDWRSDMALANAEKARVRSMVRTTDVFGIGRR
jgi:hypothetical protein